MEKIAEFFYFRFSTNEEVYDDEIVWTIYEPVDGENEEV